MDYPGCSQSYHTYDISLGPVFGISDRLAAPFCLSAFVLLCCVLTKISSSRLIRSGCTSLLIKHLAILMGRPPPPPKSTRSEEMAFTCLLSFPLHSQHTLLQTRFRIVGHDAAQTLVKPTRRRCRRSTLGFLRAFDAGPPAAMYHLGRGSRHGDRNSALWEVEGINAVYASLVR